MANLSREQVKKIIQEAPAGVDRAGLIDALVSRGHTLEGYQPTSDKRGMIDKAWDALAVPERMSREGLGKMAAAVPGREPTGNMALDIGLNIPKVAAETVAEAAPGFISRGAIATAGLLKGAKLAAPLIKTVGSQVAKGAEAISGLEYKTPGVLTAAAKDSSLLFGKGRSEAGKLYQEVIDKSNIRPIFGQATTHKELLDEAFKSANLGTLTPEEALIARQTLDEAKRSMPKFSYNTMRKMFDNIAKEVTSVADPAYAKAIKSEALRNMLPTNKLGGTSIMKSALGSIAGLAPLAAMSPLAQGTVATGAGLAARGLAPFAANAVRTGAMAGGTSAALAALRSQRQK